MRCLARAKSFRLRTSALGICCATPLIAILLCGTLWAAPPQNSKKDPDRPTLPYGMLSPSREDLFIYDSKAEPVATVSGPLWVANRTGWELIRKYFPTLGTISEETAKKVHPGDPMDARFFGRVANEDVSLSPMPLLCMIWSLAENQVSGPLKNLRDELAPAMVLEDYSTWKSDQLRKAVEVLTEPGKTGKAVKYRRPKPRLSFQQALQLYAMTLVLAGVEPQWPGPDKTNAPAPNMADFANRLRRQLPLQIPDGGGASFFLYSPGTLGQPLAKGEFEERADVVAIKRQGTTYEVEQFPVYLTNDQKKWNPSWIELKDEMKDTTLITRKWEWDWTRFDGPYLWFQPDQLNGEVLYRAVVKFQQDQIVIEAERQIERRGAVKKAERPRDYDPAKMTPFMPGVDEVAVAAAVPR